MTRINFLIREKKDNAFVPRFSFSFEIKEKINDELITRIKNVLSKEIFKDEEKKDS